MKLCRNESCKVRGVHAVSERCPARHRASDGRPFGLIEWQRANGRDFAAPAPQPRVTPTARGYRPRSYESHGRTVSTCAREGCDVTFEHYVSQRRRYCSTRCCGIVQAAKGYGRRFPGRRAG